MKREPTSGKIRPDANEGNADGAHISEDFPSEGPGSAARATKTLPFCERGTDDDLRSP